MYQALYRKYRPTTFSDVCGQEHISLTLKNQIATGKISHAYLFTGSRGTGKTSTAKILAKAVNCLNPENGDPCCKCEMCKGIDSGAVLDVSEIDAASNNGVDNIRDLRDNIAYAPVNAKYKVYIIDEVHMLTDGAFNALLKTLEEPPEHAIFILATTEVHKIPATILSRCQRYDFNRISAEVIKNRLRFICDEEKINADDDALRLIAMLADGGMRDAVGMLDLCAGSEKQVDEKAVAKSVGLIDKKYIFDLTDMISKGETANVLSEINRLYNASCDMERLCFELVSHYRDLMVAKTTPDFRTIIAATNEELDKIESQSKNIRFEHILHCVSALSDCVKTMKSGTDKRTAIETALIKLCTPSLDVTAEALLDRVSVLESKLKNGVSVNVSAGSIAPDISNTVKNEPVADTTVTPSMPKNESPAPAVDDSNEKLIVLDKWSEALEILHEKEKMIYGFLSDSKAYSLGKKLIIDTENSMFKMKVSGNREYMVRILAAVYDATGIRLNSIGIYRKTTDNVKKSDPLDNFSEKNSDVVDVIDSVEK